MALSGIDANRREIAGAACEMVAAGGLDSVSLRRIAKHLGSTTGYISHYYVDKEDLLEAALLTALQDLTTQLGEPSASLEQWIDAAVSILPATGQSPRFWRVLTAFQAASLNSTRLSDVLHRYATDQQAALTRHLAEVLPRNAAEAEIGALARTLFALITGLGTTSVITPGAFTAQQHRAVVRAAVHGLLDEFAARGASTGRQNEGPAPDGRAGAGTRR